MFGYANYNSYLCGKYTIKVVQKWDFSIFCAQET